MKTDPKMTKEFFIRILKSVGKNTIGDKHPWEPGSVGEKIKDEIESYYGI
jgi:hypothetical protein